MVNRPNKQHQKSTASCQKIEVSASSEDVAALLDWYDENGRELPWRCFWPELTPAYHVFISELMLQQTVVATVIPYFNRFIARWPDLQALAAAPIEDVLEYWAGLGYYARARNLHKAAQLLVADYDSNFPRTTDDLVKLPGIGPYTAGAIAAFAFDKPATVVDGNIERILSRYFGLRTSLPELKAEIAALYPDLIPKERRSDFPQALMDLASLVCQPKSAACDKCPLASNCVASRWNDPTILPIKPAKKAKPVRTGQAFVLLNQASQMAVLRRPEKGLLGGMIGFPSYGWDKTALDISWIERIELDEGVLQMQKADQISHIFTHFKAEIDVTTIQWPESMPLPDPLFWVPADTALPTLMAKILKSALSR